MPIEDLKERLASAEKQTTSARAEVLRLTQAWARDEAEDVERFFLDEGRLTVVNQAAVTERVRGDIPAARERVTTIAASARAAVAAWGESLTAEDALESQELRTGFQAAVKPAREEFGKLFEGLGYKKSDTSDRYAPAWAFYYPKTGTARSAIVPMGHPGQVTDSLSAYASLRACVTDLRRQIQEHDAADLWGD